MNDFTTDRTNKLFYIFFALMLLAALTACAPVIDQGPMGIQGPPGQVVVVTPPEPLEPNLVETLVDMENQYRDILGQTRLTQGLTCSLYTVPAGSAGITGTTLTSVLNYGYHGVLNQPESNATDGINILPPAVRQLYASWYVVRCTGKVVITQTDYVGFSVNSDDGSILYVDGAKVVDNDGNHGPTLKSGTKFLRQGLHDFRIDYMQGPAGVQALQVSMSGAIIPTTLLFH